MNYPIENLIIDGESDDEGQMTADGTRPPFAFLVVTERLR